MLWLSVSFAQFNGIAADEALIEPCEEVFIQAVLPAAGAQDVPLDVLPVAVVRGDCGSSAWIVQLEDADGVVADQEVAYYALNGSMRMQPEFELEPHTEYTVRWFSADGWGQEVVHTFTTGEHLAQGAASPTPGALNALAVGNDWDGWVVTADIDVRPGEDPDELQLLHLLDAQGGEIYSAVPESGVATLALGSRWLDLPPPQVCVVVAQDDGAGLRETLDEVCITPARQETERAGRRGCSTTPAGAAILLGLLAASATRRRDG